ncbi:MAG TPA: hypothetical protein VGX03_18675 [Candidatus Binatia bacterium]|jgi:hypothetical protein|nr:hypothetical protein [Candidatus Binatia bacterium]
MISTWVPFALSPAKGKRFFLLFLFALFFSSSQSSLAFAQVGGIPRIKQPPLVRIVGAFAPVDDTQRSNLQTLSVQVKAQKWKMRIREIKALTATTESGWSLLNDLFPPHLHFTGPAELLAPLQAHDIAGKPFVLEGRLYVGDHMLYLTAVTVTEP